MALMTRVGECNIKGNIPILNEIRRQRAAYDKDNMRACFEAALANRTTPTHELRIQAYKASNDTASSFLSSLWNTVKNHKTISTIAAVFAVIGVSAFSVKKVLDNKKDKQV